MRIVEWTREWGSLIISLEIPIEYGNGIGPTWRILGYFGETHEVGFESVRSGQVWEVLLYIYI